MSDFYRIPLNELTLILSATLFPSTNDIKAIVIPSIELICWKVSVRSMSLKMESLTIVSAVFLIFAGITSAAPDQHRIVETKYGQIRGFKRTSFLDKVDYYSYLGIPYAKAPLGQRRFKVS